MKTKNSNNHSMGGFYISTITHRPKSMLKTTFLILLVCFSVIVICAGISINSIAESQNHEGYIEIRTIEDLYNIRNDLKANYILMNDIDLTEATAQGGDWDFMGNGWNPIGSGDVYAGNAFEGHFAGNGHKIIGIRINVTGLPTGVGTNAYVGLFANITGTIDNLTVSGDITYKSNANFYIGSIAGSCSGEVTNCINVATVNGRGTSAAICGYVGGLIGQVNNAKISKCTNLGNVSSVRSTARGTDKFYTKNYAGGIAGDSTTETTISNCYNRGTITATSHYNQYSECIPGTYGGADRWVYHRYEGTAIAAGISHLGIINDCYNAGNINATEHTTEKYAKSYVYAIGGRATNCYNIGITSATDTNYGIASNSTQCYYLAKTCSESTGTTSLTEAQLKLKSMYKGFDFENVWILDEFAMYPYPQLRDNPQDLREAATLVSIVALPDKTNYFTGDKLNFTGSMLRVVYASGREEYIDITKDIVSGFDMNTVGEQTVTVSVGGKSDTFTINVTKRPAVLQITISSMPSKTSFVVGTAFDFTGAKALITYEGGITEYIDITFDMTTGGDINHLGKQTITYTMDEKSATFEIEVIGVKVEKIILSSLPSKLNYDEGEELDLSGMVVTAVMNNGLERTITSGYTVSGYSSKSGSYTITVTYQGKTATFKVAVACTHQNQTLTSAKQANCQEGGWDAYYTCNICSLLLSTDGTVINSVPVTPIDRNTHSNLQYFKADTPTCVHQGHDAYQKCMDCGVITEGSDVKYYGTHKYGTLIPAVPETHTQSTLSPAVAAYYQCSVCQKYFTQSKTETTLAALTGQVPSHSYGNWITTDATQHWKECSCGKKIESLAHTYDNACDQTCNTCGHTRTTTHTYGDWINTNANQHWKECDCGHKTEIATHKYDNSCDTTCNICGYTRKTTHSYGNWITTDADRHWKECDCGDKTQVEYHTYTNTCDQTCNTCGHTRTTTHTYGDWINTNANQHWKECDCGHKTEIANHKYDNSCDTTCNICAYTRQVTHTYSSVWSADEYNHWHECTVCHESKTDLGGHTGGSSTCLEKAECTVCHSTYSSIASCKYVEATDAKYLVTAATCIAPAVYKKSCSICGTPHPSETFAYGEIDQDNHVGGTYLDGQLDASCIKPGYTGDTKCSSCHKIIAAGSVLDLLAHTPSAEWSTDETHHWKTCLTDGCTYLIDKEQHSSNAATCISKSVCTVCSTEHGDINSENHCGETEIRDTKQATCLEDGSTGDTWCLDCNQMIRKGETIPAAHDTVKVPEKVASHETNGNIEHYTCKQCSLLFADAEGKHEIQAEDTVIAKQEHNYDASYLFDAEKHWKECDCGHKVKTSLHNYSDWKVVKEATTTEKGMREKSCSVCGHKVTDEIPLLETPDKNSAQTNNSGTLVLIIVAITGVLVAAGTIVAVIIVKKRKPSVH